MVNESLGWLIPVFPLIAFLVIVTFTHRFRLLSAVVALSFSALSLLLSLAILLQKISHPTASEFSTNWLSIVSNHLPVLTIQLGFLIDPLSSVMCVIVTLVATLVMLYSIGYMHGDDGFSRYFAYLSLFTFSMLGLVISNNYFETFFFWELVGLCSYLLIGFWFFKPEAAEASKKAFITNRWADFGFLVGVIGLYTVFGTFNFSELATQISVYHCTPILMGLGLLIFLGPAGKSAQVPFHVWLPDAMEGPTPVSALIHAATMVAAGIYLVARGYILFANVESVMQVIAYVGGFTALFAATIALVQRDIKRILAFSTLSQLGYMMMALGVGSMTAGMFHLTTHAFFKALLFLGAGSVIHAV
ncbi:MAG: NADH-quinone oxidoreductase subunit L, partial [Candidatus Margulisiibacteriota bacterium]